MAKNQHQIDWKLQNGALRWHEYCAHFPDPLGPLVFGNCVNENSDFLAETVLRHPQHRFIPIDQQEIEIPKSDKDISE